MRALAQVGAPRISRRLARSPADVRWLSAQIGNRQTARLLARAPADAPPREPGSGRVLPRVRIERDPKLATRLLFRYGGEIVGTLDVTGAGGRLENLQLRDFTQNRAGDLDTLEIEVRHPPGAKLKWDLWRHSIAKTKKSFGIGAVNLKLVELKPPYKRDVEIQVWPPLDYELPGIDRPETTERARKEAEERRRWEAEDHAKAVKSLAHLEQRLKSDYANYEHVQSGEVAGVISELLGGARYPMPDEWNQAYAYLFEAQKAVDNHDNHGALAWIKRANEARAAMAAKVQAFEDDRETGAGRAVKGLSAVATIGEHAAHLIPGPIGKVLSLGYEVVKPPPKTMEEAADRLHGAMGVPSGPHYGPAPRKPAVPGGKAPRGGAVPEPEPTPAPTTTTTPPAGPGKPTTVRPPSEPDPPAAKPPPEPDPPAGGTGSSPPTPRRQQQQQHQPPGQRIRQDDHPAEQNPAPNRPRQQQQQNQQQQSGPVVPRRPASLLERARAAGAGEEIEGQMEVFAYGTLKASAEATVAANRLGSGGGNFGGRRFVSTSLDTARVFAARRVTQVAEKPNVNNPNVTEPAAKPLPGVVGIALPKATAERLRAQGLLIRGRMDNPPPELASSPGEWIVEPGAIDAINADGFFFLIE